MKNTINIGLLDRFMRGETSAEEEQQLLVWFRSEEARADILDFYKNCWQDAKNSTEVDSEIQERMYRQIKARMQVISQKEVRPVEKRTYSLRRWLQYAAVVLLFIAIGVGSHLYTRQSMQLHSEYRVEADKGQRANVTLPDGTKVWLNSHSSLVYRTDYGVKERLVSLIGEAFFEVTKDKEHRFVVNARGLEVEALGTSFNVKAYEEDEVITATLFSGRIRAYDGYHSMILDPNQQIYYNVKKKHLQIDQEGNFAYARMWRDNELAFNGETLSDIAVILNRMYNIQVVFESEKIKQYRFRGVIKNNSLDNIIEIISLTAPITYKSRDNIIILSEKH